MSSGAIIGVVVGGVGGVAVVCVLLAYWCHVVLPRENRRRSRVADAEKSRAGRGEGGARRQREEVVEAAAEFGSQTG